MVHRKYLRLRGNAPTWAEIPAHRRRDDKRVPNYNGRPAWLRMLEEYINHFLNWKLFRSNWIFLQASRRLLKSKQTPPNRNGLPKVRICVFFTNVFVVLFISVRLHEKIPNQSKNILDKGTAQSAFLALKRPPSCFLSTLENEMLTKIRTKCSLIGKTS